MAYRGLPTQPWSYDDYDHIIKAEQVLESPGILFSADSKEPSRVLHHLYVLVLYLVFGESTAAFHTANIFLHLLNVWLCYLLARRLFKSEDVGLIAAFLFSINTVAYEAVYWVAASATLMGAAFGQIAVILTIRSHDRRDILLVGAAFLACCLSYESHIAILLPILYVWYIRDPRESITLPSLVVTITILFVMADAVIFSTGGHRAESNHIEVGLHLVGNVSHFVGRLFLNGFGSPVGWSGVVPFDLPGTYHTAYTYIGAAITIVLLAVGGIKGRVTMLSLWILFTALPSSLYSEARLFPRYWYLPAIASTILLAVGVAYLIRRIRSKHTIRLGVVIAGLLLLTTYQKAKSYEGDTS